MSRIELTLAAADGPCPATLFTPTHGDGPWPGVLFFTDGLGIRPALDDMARQLAELGYAVLLPDLYYRLGAYTPMVPAEVFSDPAQTAELMRKLGTLNRDRKIRDAGAFIAALQARPEVKPGRLGSVGYCMGGNVAVLAAGAHPDAFAAITSFHAGGLVTDDADSPHAHLHGISGYVYVAGADEDAHFTAAQKAVLSQALNDAGVANEVTLYAGAHHGYAVPDHPAYQAEAAARHWQVLAQLFGQRL